MWVVDIAWELFPANADVFLAYFYYLTLQDKQTNQYKYLLKKIVSKPANPRHTFFNLFNKLNLFNLKLITER